MSNWIHGLFDRIFAVIGALTLSQAPTFMQDYTQQLSGHVSELRYQIEIFRSAASQSGKTLEQFIQKFKDSPDLDLAAVGSIMQEMVVRYTNLSNSYNALVQSSVFERPFVFLKYFDWDLAKLTFADYHLGLSLTLDGFIYALIGLYLGVVIYFIFSRCLIFACRPVFKKKTPAK